MPTLSKRVPIVPILEYAHYKTDYIVKNKCASYGNYMIFILGIDCTPFGLNTNVSVCGSDGELIMNMKICGDFKFYLARGKLYLLTMSLKSPKQHGCKLFVLNDQAFLNVYSGRLTTKISLYELDDGLEDIDSVGALAIITNYFNHYNVSVLRGNNSVRLLEDIMGLNLDHPDVWVYHQVAAGALLYYDWKNKDVCREAKSTQFLCWEWGEKNSLWEYDAANKAINILSISILYVAPGM